jgi:hypothetical protein
MSEKAMETDENKISLKEHFETLIDAMQKSFCNRLDDLRKYHDNDVKSLAHHRDEATQNLKESVTQQLLTMDRSTRDTAAAMDKRLEGMNEIRGTLKDQASKFAERNEMYAIKESLEKDIRVLRESRAELHGKTEGYTAIVAIVLAVLSMLFTALGFFMKMGLFSSVK